MLVVLSFSFGVSWMQLYQLNSSSSHRSVPNVSVMLKKWSLFGITKPSASARWVRIHCAVFFPFLTSSSRTGWCSRSQMSTDCVCIPCTLKCGTSLSTVNGSFSFKKEDSSSKNAPCLLCHHHPAVLPNTKILWKVCHHQSIHSPYELLQIVCLLLDIFKESGMMWQLSLFLSLPEH